MCATCRGLRCAGLSAAHGPRCTRAVRAAGRTARAASSVAAISVPHAVTRLSRQHVRHPPHIGGEERGGPGGHRRVLGGTIGAGLKRV